MSGVWMSGVWRNVSVLFIVSCESGVCEWSSYGSKRISFARRDCRNRSCAPYHRLQK